MKKTKSVAKVKLQRWVKQNTPVLVAMVNDLSALANTHDTAV